MATLNPFDLLVDDDSEDPAQLIAAQKVIDPVSAKKGSSQATPAKKGGLAELPSKPLPPKQAVREARNEAPRGGGRGRGRGDGRGGGRSRGGRGYDRDYSDNENSNSTNNGYSSAGFGGGAEDGDSGKVSERRGGYSGGYGGTHGARRGDFSNNGDASNDGPRRVFERHTGSGRVNGIKREGAGRGNWGTPSDEIVAEIEEPINEGEKSIGTTEKQSAQETVENDKKDSPTTESEEKKEQEPEEKEMTLDEYEKVVEEKRKVLLVLKSEERKVNLDKDLESMQLLSNKKKNDDDVFVKLGSDKDKRKEVVGGDKVKKSVSINEFLKPVEGESYYRSGGRGRGRGGRGGGGGGYGGNNSRNNVENAPSIEDVRHFPTLGAK